MLVSAISVFPLLVLVLLLESLILLVAMSLRSFWLVKKISLKKPTSLMKDFFKKAVFLKIFLKLASHQHLRQNQSNSGDCLIFIDIIFNLKLSGTIMTWNARSMHKLLEFEMFLRSNNIVTNKD